MTNFLVSTLMLLRFPLQVAYAKSLPVQQAGRCQVRKLKQVQAKSKDRRSFRISSPNSTLLSFPTSPTQTSLAFLALGILTLTLHFRNKVSPKQTCLHHFPSIMKNLNILFLLFEYFVVNGFRIILEDLASSICSDEQKIKGQLR